MSKTDPTPPLDLAAIPDDTYLRKAQVLSIFPFSGPTLRRRILDGKFPAPEYISDRIPAWKARVLREAQAAMAAARAARRASA